jgi:hypothetical protein
VADTNNHRIVRINLATHEWCEIVFKGLTAPASRGLQPARTDELTSDNLDPSPKSQPLIQSKPMVVAPDREVELLLDIALPPGTHLNAEAPWTVQVTADGTTLAKQTGRSESAPLFLKVPSGTGALDRDWIVRADFTYCTDGASGSCIPAELVWRVPVKPGNGQRITLRGSVA